MVTILPYTSYNEVRHGARVSERIMPQGNLVSGDAPRPPTTGCTNQVVATSTGRRSLGNTLSLLYRRNCLDNLFHELIVDGLTREPAAIKERTYQLRDYSVLIGI